jgi:hypothetical protein
LRVKYQCPELARVKLEISPEIHVNGKLRSSNCATAWLSADTGSIDSVFIGLCVKRSDAISRLRVKLSTSKGKVAEACHARS